MNIRVIDLDGVLQDPVDPHPRLFGDVATVVGVTYDALYKHYTESYEDNEKEERYHLSLCKTSEQMERVRERWKQLHANMDKVEPIPGARELLEHFQGQGDELYAFTKGPVDIQKGRLESVGLSEFFPEGHIIFSPRKGTREGVAEDLLPGLPQGGKIAIVGDMFEQDIRPALEVGGITCVWIRWDQEVPKDVDLNSPNLIIVESTQELVTKIKEGLLDVQGDH